ncbi:MAG: lytic transglycosylase domain-containing protein, partial [Acidobacteria bacterium]|nr:lytic transglycosylase domain-containing protein [Acidobacteriota bacterium]
MRIKYSFSPTFVSFVLLFAALGCQTAKKPSAAAPSLPTTIPPVKPAAPAPQSSSDAVVAHVGDATGEQSRPISSPETRPDPVEELIRKADKQYQAGLDDSKAGRNASAKEHFEQALNLMVGAPSGMRSDPRFQSEYDRVLEGKNQLQLVALEQSDSAVEQKSQPAPIDEANEVTNYPVDPKLKAKATADIQATHSDLPLMMTDQVAGYINYFSTHGHGTLERALARSGRYREMIERILKEEGVPQDLIYLAQAESGFYPYAISRAGARGIWQFMASRARAYDLHRDFWMDERQDPEKSTRAAARHLRDLYNQFGDWYLAMAAYNSGPGTVQNAVKRTGYADFWELYHRDVLPKETRNYVPIIVAVTIMAKNPNQYGLDAIVPDREIAYETVKIN